VLTVTLPATWKDQDPPSNSSQGRGAAALPTLGLHRIRDIQHGQVLEIRTDLSFSGRQENVTRSGKLRDDTPVSLCRTTPNSQRRSDTRKVPQHSAVLRYS
jgi:hypothetical protein